MLRAERRGIGAAPPELLARHAEEVGTLQYRLDALQVHWGMA